MTSIARSGCQVVTRSTLQHPAVMAAISVWCSRQQALNFYANLCRMQHRLPPTVTSKSPESLASQKAGRQPACTRGFMNTHSEAGFHETGKAAKHLEASGPFVWSCRQHKLSTHRLPSFVARRHKLAMRPCAPCARPTSGFRDHLREPLQADRASSGTSCPTCTSLHAETRGRFSLQTEPDWLDRVH